MNERSHKKKNTLHAGYLWALSDSGHLTGNVWGKYPVRKTHNWSRRGAPFGAAAVHRIRGVKWQRTPMIMSIHVFHRKTCQRS